jgi:hypothetical protein
MRYPETIYRTSTFGGLLNVGWFTRDIRLVYASGEMAKSGVLMPSPWRFGASLRKFHTNAEDWV